jgi:hypothetical protein
VSDAVLITGARAPVAVDLGRSFAAAGYAVHFADSVTPWAARFSKAATAVHRLPPPRTAFAAFRQALDRLVERINPIAIIPTCEEVFYVSATGLPNVLAPPLPILRKLHSKIDFAHHAAALGLDVPETWRIETQDDLNRLSFAPTELVFKPEFSRFATHTRIRPAIAPEVTHPLAAQVFVAGDEICLWSFARDGKIVAWAAYRPRWRHGTSAAFAFERVKCPAALSVAQTIAAADAITGHLSFDFIITPEGKAIPIECNPRAVSGLHLFDAAPDLARAMLGEGVANAPTTDLRYLGLAMALLGPAAGRFGDLARDVRQGRDVIGRAGDRLPMIGALLDAGRFAIRGAFGGRSASAQSTHDIEWNGDAIANPAARV